MSKWYYNYLFGEIIHNFQPKVQRDNFGLIERWRQFESFNDFVEGFMRFMRFVDLENLEKLQWEKESDDIILFVLIYRTLFKKERIQIECLMTNRGILCYQTRQFFDFYEKTSFSAWDSEQLDGDDKFYLHNTILSTSRCDTCWERIKDSRIWKADELWQ